MSVNRKILIWIGVFALIGIILLMVACETGVLLTKELPPAEELPETESTEKEPVEPKQETTQPDEKVEEKPKTLTVGKPYSGKLVEEGSRNILIIGEDKLNDLYDTIGIVSVDSKSKKVKIIMIPRDTYIEYNQEIMAKLEEMKLANSPGVYKINYAHHIGNKMEYKGKFDSGPSSFLAEVIKEKFGVEIDDYVKINIRGFKSLINHLGGVDVYVPYDMNYDDPLQDLSIHIPKGMRHLDGEAAEGFVRFRQGYKEDGTLFEIGDTGRKKNQITFIKELIKQKGTIKNVGKIPGMIELLGKNVQHSIGVGDILQTYIGMATNIISDKYEIDSENLNSEKMTRINGSSYLVFE